MKISSTKILIPMTPYFNKKISKKCTSQSDLFYYIDIIPSKNFHFDIAFTKK